VTRTGPARLLKVAPAQLLPLLDRSALFRRRWQMLPPGPNRTAQLKAGRTLKELWQATLKEKLWQPRGLVRLCDACAGTRGLLLYSPGATRPIAELMLAARFFGRAGTARFRAAVQIVTVGPKIVEACRQLARTGDVARQFLLHGLAAELTEALANFAEKTAARTLELPLSRRVSPGYPVWPDLTEQKKLFRLLRPSRIGLRLTAAFQIVPEYSTSALVLPRWFERR